MCGIAGLVAPDCRRYEPALSRMAASLGKRGPDGSGIHFFRNCGFGHTRLSIVDIETGRQPMSTADTKTGITFNGEIYGYKSIRETIDDFPFQTKSDTEVILALYRRFGSDLFNHLPGMFAFAIWDEEEQMLLCGRDRFGEKPLYYAFGTNGEFLFASEIKALLASGLIRPVLNLDSVVHYLKFLYVHPHQTIYRNVHTLPPAHCLQYRHGRVSVERYWSLPAPGLRMTLDEAAGEFRRLLDASISRQLVADVDVGAFLSGGLDSSSIVALASRHKASLKTFSFGFEESVSELPFAREVARMYGTDHMELRTGTVDLAELMTEMQDVYDEPMADSSNIPTYLISKLARRYVKVVLTGDGGDELFGGYSYWYRPIYFMNNRPPVRHWYSDIFRAAASIVRRTGIPPAPSSRYRLLGALYRNSGCSIASTHCEQKRYLTDRELERIMPASGRIPLEAVGMNWKSGTVDDAMRMDIEDYMPGDILMKIDRASMSNGLELRAPFLDVEFASFCISLPDSLKIDGEREKVILREAMRTAWPPSIRNREKLGFGAPVARWLKEGAVRSLKRRYLSDPGQKIFSLISHRHTRDMVARDNYNTWALLVLSMWMDRHDFDFDKQGDSRL